MHYELICIFNKSVITIWICEVIICLFIFLN
uniref:Uncharacterized protein n=1 Tax=Rhizophora mucronata TaxID=61149 RepID=A0A2P2Q030_RHIMU